MRNKGNTQNSKEVRNLKSKAVWWKLYEISVASQQHAFSLLPWEWETSCKTTSLVLWFTKSGEFRVNSWNLYMFNLTSYWTWFKMWHWDNAGSVVITLILPKVLDLQSGKINEYSSDFFFLSHCRIFAKLGKF